VNNIHNSALPGGATRCEHPRVRNSALGRGLGELMKPRPANRSVNPTIVPAAEPESRPSGVRIFLKPTDTERNGNGHAPKPTPNAVPAHPAMSRSLLVTLLLADVVLCALAWFVVARSPGAVGWLGWLLVALAVALGSWLSLLAVRGAGSKPPPNDNDLTGAG
jgi:hypothetical protein